MDGPTSASTARKTILLVEDNAEFRDTLQHLLEAHGYAVIPAGSGEAALQHLQVKSPPHVDLLLADLVLPGIDGIKLADRLRRVYDRLPVVYITGYSGKKEPPPSLDNRSVLLRKPIRPDKLLGDIQKLLSAR